MSDNTPKPWWEHLSSTLIALAVLITAVTGLLVLFLPPNPDIPSPNHDHSGSHERGWIGVSLRAATLEDIDPPVGAVVTSINGRPAEDAGIEIGDIITSFDGRKVEDHISLQNLIQEAKVGKLVKFEIIDKNNKFHSSWVRIGSH